MSIAEKFYTMEYGAAPEDPKEAVEWLERHHRRFEEFIGGAWVAPASGEYQTTSDPSNGETLAEVAKGNLEDVNAAVAAARKAQPGWQALTRESAGAVSVCAGTAGAEACAAAGGAGVDG